MKQLQKRIDATYENITYEGAIYEKMYMIKKPRWEVNNNQEDHITSYGFDTPFGYYSVNHFLAQGNMKAWFTYMLPGFKESYRCGSVEEGKALCELNYRNLIFQCLE